MLTKINSQQNFRALNTRDAERYLFPRLNSPTKYLRLNNLVKAQQNNLCDIELFTNDQNNTLSAFVYDKEKKVNKIFNQGFFAELFSSPLKFIAKVCEYADELNKV